MQAWEDFLTKQEALLGKQIIDQWLRPLKIIHFDSANLYLEAANTFSLLWFEEHIRPIVKTHLVNNNFRPIKVHLSAREDLPVEKKGKKEKNRGIPPLILTPDKLNSECTLESFVPGLANAMLYRFCQELGSTPSPINPIFFWGGPGTGKTHLLMAIAHAFKKQNLNVLYAKAETFTEHVVAAIRNSEMQTFRNAYRNVDVLIVDDIHIFARKAATQEEFFHTFNALHSVGKQIILSANCAASLLDAIEPRLVSRFEWGISLHIEKLDPEELKQVLLKRTISTHFPLNEDVCSFLVSTFPTSHSLHRAFEALLLRTHMEDNAIFKRSPDLISKEKAKQMLADLINQEGLIALSAEKIIAAVSSHYGVGPEDVLGKSQSNECVVPRQLAMYLCRKELRLPFMKIGQIFSRDHSTVMTSTKLIESKIEKQDKELMPALSALRRVLGTS